MPKPTYDIKVGSLRFFFVHRYRIETAWDRLTDTAEMELPQNLDWDRYNLREVIAPGQFVSISAGYDDDLETLFSGYITRIAPDVPVKIHCEDEMWKLKQQIVTYSAVNATTEVVARDFYGEYQRNVLNADLGAVVYDQISRAQVLEELKKEYGLPSFFRAGVLNIGKPYDPARARSVTFRFQYNIVKSRLEYVREEDVKVKVTAISNQPDGNKLEVQLGDSEGQPRTLNFYDMAEGELRKAAERELSRLKYTGFRGSFDTFGAPTVRHGDIVTLQHPDRSDQSGRYWVDAVEYKGGVDGLSQKITLGPAT